MTDVNQLRAIIKADPCKTIDVAKQLNDNHSIITLLGGGGKKKKKKKPH